MAYLHLNSVYKLIKNLGLSLDPVSIKSMDPDLLHWFKLNPEHPFEMKPFHFLSGPRTPWLD
jgi:hypothetical protein